jgi:hypothetical protein
MPSFLRIKLTLLLQEPLTNLFQSRKMNYVFEYSCAKMTDMIVEIFGEKTNSVRFLKNSGVFGVKFCTVPLVPLVPLAAIPNVK